jgi:hypothetical protein
MGRLRGGGDVIKELNDVFSKPKSDEYKYAQDNNLFGAIPYGPGNYQDLINAYKAAGIPVSQAWADYLEQLGTLDPQQGPLNIYYIAQARYACLKNGVAISTKTHQHGGKVIVSGSTIDSPWPIV